MSQYAFSHYVLLQNKSAAFTETWKYVISL